jgi:hypothetical protein
LPADREWRESGGMRHQLANAAALLMERVPSFLDDVE